MAETFNNYLVKAPLLNGNKIIVPTAGGNIQFADGIGTRPQNSISEVHSIYVTLSSVTTYITDIDNNSALIDIYIKNNNKDYYIAKAIKLVPNSSFYIEKTITLKADDALYIYSQNGKNIDIVCSTVDVIVDS